MIFFAGPAWGRASLDFFFAGPARAGASHDFYFAGPAGLGASHDFYFACEIKIMTRQNKNFMTAGALFPVIPLGRIEGSRECVWKRMFYKVLKQF